MLLVERTKLQFAEIARLRIRDFDWQAGTVLGHKMDGECLAWCRWYSTLRRRWCQWFFATKRGRRLDRQEIQSCVMLAYGRLKKANSRPSEAQTEAERAFAAQLSRTPRKSQGNGAAGSSVLLIRDGQHVKAIPRKLEEEAAYV